MRKVFCPTEIKEIKEILLPARCEPLSAISFISAGRLLLHADSFYCPAVIGFAASLVEEMKEIKEILLPSLCEALSAISALSAGRLLSHAESFYCPAEIKEIAEIIVTDPREVLSALSA